MDGGDESASARTFGRFRVRRFELAVACVAVFGLALRLVYRVAFDQTLISGDGSYFHFGANYLAEGRGFINAITYLFGGVSTPGAEHPPGWIVVLSVPSWLGFKTRTEHEIFASLIGVATIVVMAYAGRRLAGPRAGLVAAAITALYPGFWLYERQLLSETLAVLLAAVVMLLALRFRARPTWPRAVWVGLTCGVLALTRTEMVLLIGVLLIPLTLFVAGASWKRRVGWLAFGVGAALLVVTPWVVYNLSRFDKPVLISSQGGRTLAASNCDTAYYGPLLGYKSLSDPNCHRREEVDRYVARTSERLGRRVDESWEDAELRRLAQRYIDDHRDRLLVVVPAREGRTWGLFRPFQQFRLDLISGDIWMFWLQYFNYLAMLPFAIAGVVTLRHRPARLWPPFALILTVAVTVAVTFGSTRYRAPADVGIALLAAAGVAAAVKALATRWTAPEQGEGPRRTEESQQPRRPRKPRKLRPIT